MKLIKRPSALRDLIELAEYIAEEDLEVANRLFDAFENTLDRLKLSPKIGKLRNHRGVKNLRMWFIVGFQNCLIFYTENNSEIVILRIIHSARDFRRFFEEE
jgi:toxin ParE1/3/4